MYFVLPPNDMIVTVWIFEQSQRRKTLFNVSLCVVQKTQLDDLCVAWVALFQLICQLILQLDESLKKGISFTGSFF